MAPGQEETGKLDGNQETAPAEANDMEFPVRVGSLIQRPQRVVRRLPRQRQLEKEPSRMPVRMELVGKD